MTISPHEFKKAGEALDPGRRTRIEHSCGDGRTLIVSRDHKGISAYCFRCHKKGYIPTERSLAERIAALAPYQVNAALMAKADPNAIFMHCLPAYHDKKTAIGNEMCTRFGREAMEVTDDVFESAQSVVFQEAENRMHTIKAVMAATLAEIEL